MSTVLEQLTIVTIERAIHCWLNCQHDSAYETVFCFNLFAESYFQCVLCDDNHLAIITYGTASGYCHSEAK